MLMDSGSIWGALLLVENLAYGSIMSVPVFLSSNCFGPFHFFHTHLR